MKLSNPKQATVDREKIEVYLLKPVHPGNGGKADFFTRLGFHRERLEVLAAALKALAITGEVMSASETPHCKKYIVTGRIQTPGGKLPLCRASG